MEGPQLRITVAQRGVGAWMGGRGGGWAYPWRRQCTCHEGRSRGRITVARVRSGAGPAPTGGGAATDAPARIRVGLGLARARARLGPGPSPEKLNIPAIESAANARRPSALGGQLTSPRAAAGAARGRRAA